MRVRIENSSRQRVLAEEARIASNPWERTRGLLGRSGLATGEGLIIRPCQAVHTFFMRFPIDVLFVDRSGRVVGVRSCLRPMRMSRLYRRAAYVIELPSGVLEQTATAVGDLVALRDSPGD